MKRKNLWQDYNILYRADDLFHSEMQFDISVQWRGKIGISTLERRGGSEVYKNDTEEGDDTMFSWWPDMAVCTFYRA